MAIWREITWYRKYFDISRDISYDNGGFVSIKFTFKNKKNRYSDIFSLDDERLDLLNDFSKESIKTKLEINKDDGIKILQEQADFIEEINYLLQKKLFSFLTSIEEAKLRWCFKYFILDRDYKKIEYDIFWNEINKNMINKMGTAYKYKISYSDMKAEYFEFKKKLYSRQIINLFIVMIFKWLKRWDGNKSISC